MAAVIAACFVASGCWAATADSGLNMVTDVIVGHNTKGPYTLSWKNFDAGSASVVIYGRTLRKGSDYSIDAGNGVVAFNSVLVTDAIVRVSYRTVPGESQKTSGKVEVPVTLSLAERTDSSLKLTGLYAQKDAADPESGITVLGLTGNKNWESSRLDSQLLVSQNTGAGASEDAAPVWDRSSFKLGGDTSYGDLKFTGSYMHTGDDFEAAKQYGVTSGTEATDLSALFAPDDKLKLQAKYQTNEVTTGKNAGARSLVNEQSLMYSLLSSTRVSFTHSLKETVTAAGSEKNVDSNLVRLDQQIGSKTNAVATFEDATIETNGTAEDLQTNTVQLATNPSDRLKLTGAVTQKDSSLYGEEIGTQVGVSAKPTDNLKVDAGFGTLENETVGHQTKTSVAVTASLIESLSIGASYLDTDSTLLGQTTNTKLTFGVHPFQNLQIQGNLVGKDQGSSSNFERNVSVSSSPTRYSKLTALFAQKGINSLDDVTKGATLELTPADQMKLQAGYQYIETGAEVMTVKDYAAETKPWKFLSLTGSLRDRELRGGEAVDTRSLQVSLASGKLLTLTGNYQENPENKKGVIQPYKNTVLGVKSSIGSVALSADYAEKDEYQANTLSEQRKYGLEMPFFGSGRLSAGYETTRLLTGSALSTRTYCLGYRHCIGDDFSLLLQGSYTQYLQDNTVLPDENEYKAEANLGLRF